MESERREIVTKWIFGYLRNQKELFNNSALEVYSKLLFFVVAGDGAISPAEREWIIGHRAASGVSDEILQRFKTYNPTGDEWKDLLQQNREFIELAKYALIHDAFHAAAADNELHAKEREAISKLGREMNVDEATIEQIAQLYHEETKLKQRRIALLYPKGVDETIRDAKITAKP